MTNNIPVITEENKVFASQYWQFADILTKYVNLTFDFENEVFPDGGEFSSLSVFQTEDRYIFEFLYKDENGYVEGFIGLRLQDQEFVVDRSLNSIFKIVEFPSDTRPKMTVNAIHLNGSRGGPVQLAEGELYGYKEDDGTIADKIKEAMIKVVGATGVQITNEMRATANAAGIGDEAIEHYKNESLLMKNKIIRFINDNGGINTLPVVDGYVLSFERDERHGTISLSKKDEPFEIDFLVRVGDDGAFLESYSPSICMVEAKNGDVFEVVKLYRMYGKERLESVIITEEGITPFSDLAPKHFQIALEITNNFTDHKPASPTI